MIQNVVERKIMWGDLDALGIVFYPRYYEWIDASGHLFFDKLELNLGKLWSERGIQFGLGETNCRYHRPGRYHQKIRIVTEIKSLASKRVDLSHQIYLCEDNALLVDGLEKRICMDVSDPAHFRACQIPADIVEILLRAAGD
jgi:YbgC/YbaW family acyl-CoA thioester hydrolase